MNQKKAKMLRKLANYRPGPHNLREEVVVAKKRFVRFNADGSSEDVILDRKMVINRDKQVYNRYKKAYYALKTQGGARHAKKRI